MNTIIQKYNITNIWHFTDGANLDSIQEHGLLAFAEAQRRGIEIPAPGGNELSHGLDKIKELDEYVHLTFVDNHPMLFLAKKERIPDPVWIEIDSSIMLDEGVRFSSDVANKTEVAILNAEEAKKQIDFEVLFTRTDWKNPNIQARLKKARKSEILIPRRVSVEKILSWKNG
ncbi:DarT ssDNA thymidine ADP-ribosyltransferase family protein [Candidatus Spongiihabitans sp.]|uniref:DarT ssDNA thymidine ADP-ribosyltransferase family protein n=1 Tax=Candidatus Spongiihabitans sp. TaxID=3101308 RepID=UPI003C7DE7F5